MKNDENISFEAAFARLEEIVKALEEGKASLDESMKLYEEGVSLVRICGGKLENARRTVLKVTNGGETLEDFPPMKTEAGND